MSYILDALRRAERERALGQIPVAETLSVVAHKPSRRPQFLVLGAATVVLVTGMTTLVLFKSARQPEPPASTTTGPDEHLSVSPSRADPALGQTAAGATQSAAHASEPRPVFEDDAALGSLDDVAPPFSARPLIAETHSVANGEAQAEPADVEAVADVEAADASPAASAMEAMDVATSNSAPATGPAADQPAPQPATLRLLREMPPAFRARFPPVTLQVHVYDDDPAKRWVMVDNRRYREGGRLDSGPTVVEITADGVIFALQGEQVLWPLVR